MMGLLLLLTLMASTAGGYAWLYLVSPRKDLDRIKADQGGTGALAFTIKRTGTKYFGGEEVWVADHLMGVAGSGFCRVYQVTVERAGGASETYAIAVEAKLFGLPGVRRIDPRAGE
jgi:hypothetical protein